MTREEKLAEAKRLYKTANADQRYVLECLFPELKEDEVVPHWISVEDELPKERQWVIVYGATSDLAPIDTSCFESKSAWEWLGVTHWMPLPQPPKKGGEK